MKRVIRELNRLYSQYLAAVRIEAQQHGLVRSVLRIIVSRLFYGVGPRYFSLFGFSTLPRESWDEYVTDDPRFKQYLLGQTPARIAELLNDKALFYEHCLEHELPTIPILGIVTFDDRAGYRSVSRISSVDEWQRMLETAPEELFVKPVDGTFGENAFHVARRGPCVDYCGRSTSPEALYEYLCSKLGDERGWLIQPRMRTHASLRSIMSPNGLGTLRVVTRSLPTGAVDIMYCVAKITVGDNPTDNFHHGRSGNLVCAVDLDTGRLRAARGSRERHWPVITAYSHHPETVSAIEGFQLEQWDRITALALQAQKSLPLLRSAGWDIALTENGPIVVEGNITYSVDILQVAYGRGLKKEIPRLLEAAA